MILCRVEGNVVSTARHPDFDGLKLLIVQPLDADGNDTGAPLLAVDRVQAGPGDRVLVMREGNGVRQLFQRPKFCIRSVIVGVVDETDVSGTSGDAFASNA